MYLTKSFRLEIHHCQIHLPRVLLILSWIGLFGLLGVINLGAAQNATDKDSAVYFDQDTLQAKGEQQTVLHTPAFGRYAIIAQSNQGSAIRMVDRLSGPGPVYGTPGSLDGRMDVFLDKGQYLIKTISHKKGQGEVRVKAVAFEEQNTDKALRLVEHRLINTRLDDFQIRSYWIDIKARQTIAVEAAGRSLADLRLWQDGNWLVNISPQITTTIPEKGKPLTSMHIVADLNPGLYLLAAYGGPAIAWAKDEQESPLYIRMGIPGLGEAGRFRFKMSPFGVDRYLIAKQATYVALALDKPQKASIQINDYSITSPFPGYGDTRYISRKSKTPVAELNAYYARSGFRVVTVRADAHTPYILQFFQYTNQYRIDGKGDYFLSTISSGFAQDDIDATAVLVKQTQMGKTSLDRHSVIDIDAHKGYKRTFNLLGQTSLFVRVNTSGRYITRGQRINAQYQLEPFFTEKPANYSRPGFKPTGSQWDLEKGLYVLTIKPFGNDKGNMDFCFLPENSENCMALPANELKTVSLFADIKLDPDHYYTLYYNQQPQVRTGIVLRKSPVDLSVPLPVTQDQDQVLSIQVTLPQKGKIKAVSENQGMLPIEIDQGRYDESAELAPGRYGLRIRNRTGHPIHYAVIFTPAVADQNAPVPELPPKILDQIVQFDPLSENQPEFADLKRSQSKTFAITVKDPALYRLETSGLLETRGTLRTRTIPQFDQQAQNGIGRNFLIQQYLQNGDYQLTVMPVANTKGHLGVALRKTRLNFGGQLNLKEPSRYFLPTGQALMYEFTIDEADHYRFIAMGMNRRFAIRLEDQDGWPIIKPATAGDVTVFLKPGKYRAIILPQDIDARVVCVLSRDPSSRQPVFSGHGPHLLSPESIGRQVAFQWQEPADGQDRVPDKWQFTVPAALDAKISVSEDMQATLTRKDVENAVPITLNLTSKGKWKSRLESGTYELALKCARINNRFDYHFKIDFVHLTEGFDRQIQAPAKIPVSIGENNRIELYSFGDQDVKAQLFSESGTLVMQNDDQPKDWNFSLSGRIAPGFYRLLVKPVGSQNAATRVFMKSVATLSEDPLELPAKTTVRDNALHRYNLDIPEFETVLIVGAQGSENTELALTYRNEKTDCELGRIRGKNPVLTVALSSAIKSSQVYLTVKNHDAPAKTVTISAATIAPHTYPEKEFVGEGVGFARSVDDLSGFGVTRIKLSSPGVFQLPRETDQMIVATEPLTQLVPVNNGMIVGSYQYLWIAQKINDMDLKPAKAKRMKLSEKKPLILDMQSEQTKSLPMLTVDTKTVFDEPSMVLIQSRAGRLGIKSGNRNQKLPDPAYAMGLDGQSAVAVNLYPNQSYASVWNADPAARSLMATLSAYRFETLGTREISWGVHDFILSTNRYLQGKLPSGRCRAVLSLAPLSAAVFTRDNQIVNTFWSDHEGQTYRFESQADQMILLSINPLDSHIGLTLLPTGKDEPQNTLVSSNAFKSYLPESTRLVLDIVLSETEKSSGVVFHCIGPHVNTVLVDANGNIKSGDRIDLNDNARAYIDHEPGLILAWIEGGDQNPWEISSLDKGPLEESTIYESGQIHLTGPGMRLHFNPEAGKLMHLSTDIPVVAQFTCADNELPVVRYEAGAQINAFLPAGHSSFFMIPVDSGVLNGTADVLFDDISEIGEGIGPTTRIAPGQARIYKFTLDHSGNVGIGIKSSADIADCALLDIFGKVLGRGVVQMHALKPGTYFVMIKIPANSVSIEAQPVAIGLKQPDTGPSIEIVKQYLEMEGLKPKQ